MIIDKAYLFQDMSPQFAERIAQCLVWESPRPGDFLFRRGDPADHLYILGQGRVRLSYGEEGNVAFVVRNPGDAFGWSSLVDRDAYTATAVCLDATTVAKVRKADLAGIFSQDPASGLIFYKRLSKLLGERVLDFYRLIPAAHGEKRVAPGF